MSNTVEVAAERDMHHDTLRYHIDISIDYLALDALSLEMLKSLQRALTPDTPVYIQLSMLSTVFQSLREQGLAK